MKDLLRRILYKCTSTKFVITIWAMVMVSYMTFTKTLDNPVSYILAAVPIAYCGFNVLQHRKDDDK